ncbi:DNA/RNA helicase [Aphelenchoides avenae]|nr:DNA/RNA helicase [Aphelenchus avenae]
MHNSLVNFKKCTIRYFLDNYDCIVQAPTGSGKTLAYVLPTLQMISKKRQQNSSAACEIYALILVPSRELVAQVGDVCEPLCKKLGFTTVRFVGGGGAKNRPENLKGQCVVVTTPGRFANLLEKVDGLKNWLKALEVLIIDEADRFVDVEFRNSATAILEALPKQRRTGLFSATQAKDVEDLVKFGLRNPVRLRVTSEKKTMVDEDADNGGDSKAKADVAPKELSNYYTCVDADKKLLALVEFLNAHKTSKVLVFMSSSNSVEYFAKILPPFLGKKTQMLALHGKKKGKRDRIVKHFRATKKCVLLSTDLMARGIDVVDIDWVVQFDIPKHSSWFVHRSGRSGRSGREGSALVFLTKEESAYVKFMQNYESVQLQELQIDGLTDDKAEELRRKVQELATSDRQILEDGSRAFVSHIMAYSKHDCQIVCRLKDLDVVGMAHAFGLLRLPKMPELSGHDLSTFKRSDVDTSKIPFKDEKRETARQTALQERFKPKEIVKKAPSRGQRQRSQSESKHEKANVQNEGPRKRKKGPKKSEWEQLQEEERILKKFKKGKISKDELNQKFDKRQQEAEDSDDFE